MNGSVSSSAITSVTATVPAHVAARATAIRVRFEAGSKPVLENDADNGDDDAEHDREDELMDLGIGHRRVPWLIAAAVSATTDAVATVPAAGATARITAAIGGTGLGPCAAKETETDHGGNRAHDAQPHYSVAHAIPPQMPLAEREGNPT
jgi:hypothetical protein